MAESQPPMASRDCVVTSGRKVRCLGTFWSMLPAAACLHAMSRLTAQGGQSKPFTFAPSSGGLFGASSSPSLFGQTGAGGGIFGNTPAGGNLFGQPQSSPAGGNLFGGSPAPFGGGGNLFGQPQSQPAPFGGGLFGAGAGGSFGGGNLFGQPQQQQQQPQQQQQNALALQAPGGCQ